MFIGSLGLLAGGILKFEGFPDTDGDAAEFRLRMPAGTPLDVTQSEVDRVVEGLKLVDATLTPDQPGEAPLVENIVVRMNYNPDSPDSGPHIATVKADLLSVEVRSTTLDELKTAWRDAVGPISDATSASFANAQMGPGGAAIELRVQGRDLRRMSDAAAEVEAWMGSFEGVFDLGTDLQPGTPQVGFVFVLGRWGPQRSRPRWHSNSGPHSPEIERKTFVSARRTTR